MEVETQAQSLPAAFYNPSFFYSHNDLGSRDFRSSEMPQVDPKCTASEVLAPLVDNGAKASETDAPGGEWSELIVAVKVAELFPTDLSLEKGSLRDECVKFSLVHANKFDPLLSFLDELSDLSRFRTLELKLQSCLLDHLVDLIKVFSGSRLEKVMMSVATSLRLLHINHMTPMKQAYYEFHAGRVSIGV
ncbi:hypothetical protein C1H46_000448 [Malus baccata]|uniref:Uncharacterized protein n=1 Tax=Malus baccata TaxID=106549 RepID=A0A540NS05_MALBA|nr:hypothetical protein C1H46_000448 [Malus baccata]